MTWLTFVRIFAPSENPIPNKGRKGKFFRNQRTVCRTSQVARALYNIELVTLEFAHPRKLTTHTSQPCLWSGSTIFRRYGSCDPPDKPCKTTSMGFLSSDGRAENSSFVKKLVRGDGCVESGGVEDSNVPLSDCSEVRELLVLLTS